MLGPSLSSMCTLHYPVNSTATTTKLMMFKYMPYGITLSSLILDLCITHTLNNLPNDNPNIKHIHYVDDLAQIAKSRDELEIVQRSQVVQRSSSKRLLQSQQLYYT